ncbi:MAG: hypothetical protein K2X27_07665 [Candidatus Obscuribacterales bacterium]|nr:hypothetical protein [Candidatus Obscuribacterales bacterium]
MKSAFKVSAAAIAFSYLATAAVQAQDSQSLNSLIKNESAALKNVEGDLGPNARQSIEGIADQLGAQSVRKDLNQVSSNNASQFSTNNLMGDLNSLSGQLSHLPGVAQLLGSIAGACSAFGNRSQQFTKPAIESKLLHSQSNSQQSTSILGTLSSTLGMNTLNSAMQSPAAESEMKEAGSVMPQAIKNLEEENQEYKQLMNE